MERGKFGKKKKGNGERGKESEGGGVRKEKGKGCFFGGVMDR